MSFFGLSSPFGIIALVAIILLALPLLFVLLAPLLILAVQTFNADAAMELIGPDERQPEGAQATDERILALRGLGFEPVASFRCPDFVPTIMSEITVLAHRPTATQAAVLVSYFRLSGQPIKFRIAVTEFISNFTGLELSTIDGRMIVEVVPRRDRRILHAGPNWTARELFAIHRERVRRHGMTPKPVPADGALIEDLRGQIKRDIERWLRRGYVRPAPRKRGTHRPTFIGAYVMTWRCLPPYSTIRLRRDARVARRLLEGTTLRGH